MGRPDQDGKPAIIAPVTALFPADVDFVIALPDSILTPLIRRVIAHPRLQYIQVVHEAQAVGLAAGLSLAGRRPLVVMENSGLRSAAESIGRLVVLHQIHLLFLVSGRGGFGDPNWWAQYHSRHAEEIARTFGLGYVEVKSAEEIGLCIHRGLSQVRTRNRSVVLSIDPAAMDGV